MTLPPERPDKKESAKAAILGIFNRELAKSLLSLKEIGYALSMDFEALEVKEALQELLKEGNIEHIQTSSDEIRYRRVSSKKLGIDL